MEKKLYRTQVLYNTVGPYFLFVTSHVGIVHILKQVIQMFKFKIICTVFT
jgi:hypothetical protein